VTAAVLPLPALEAGAEIPNAVLREIVADALGPLAGRAACTVEEVAELLGVARATAYEAVHAGTVPSLRIGRRVVVPVPALAAVLLGVSENGARE
jgi:excisionase family DNA binding protein